MSSITLTFWACAPEERTPQDEWPDFDAIYAHDTARPNTRVPNPSFSPVAPSGIDFRRSALRQEGEIIIIEGDSRTVSFNGAGYGIADENEVAIVQDVLAMYPDEFDTIQIFLSFSDDANAGAAYYSSIKNEVQGIGIDQFNGRAAYGLEAEGRLSGFSNMNHMEMFGDLSTLTTPRGAYYSVMAQELSHRWLMVLKFKDGSGAISDAFLGRQGAHWSALVHAYGSCQDGIFWRDNGDGTFTHEGESDRGWAPIDQYAMGIRSRDEVEPFFYLVEANLEGRELGAESHRDIPRLARVNARKIAVEAVQVSDALGPRNPPAGTETPYYRVALVLVTAPGQPESEWRPFAEVLKEVGETFPATWKEWTNGKGAICTKVSERCPEPLIGLEKVEIVDGNDNLLAPGEDFELALTVRNDGIGTTRDLSVSIEPLSGVSLRAATPIAVSSVAARETVALPSRFLMSAGAEVECGTVVTMIAHFDTAEGPRFSAPIEIPVGTQTLKIDRMNDDADWTVNPDGDDNAVAGMWALDIPDFISLLGVVTQPVDDHSPGEAKLAFMTGPKKGSSFSDHDVDSGRTTLESPVFALGDARDPTLVFYAWHVALDFTQVPPQPVIGAELVVQGSNDGGRSWVEMTRFAAQTKEWERVSLRIRDSLPLSNRMRFRFVLEDTSRSGNVEAGIDDLEIIDYLDVCPVEGEMPDAGPPVMPMPRDTGCGCTAAGAPRLDASGVGGAIIAVLAVFSLRRRRSR